jgi:hypothetical protein
MTEFAEDLRHHCRNPRCRMKLTAPVVNPHRAFCTRKLCRRPKCEGRYRKNSAHYSFLGADTTSAANALRSAQFTGIKSADFDNRPCYIVAGPKITAAVYHCATLPVDPDIAARVNAANEWGRIRKEMLGPSPGRPLRRKCNRIGSPARQAFRSRTISQHPRLSQTRF